MLRIVVSSAPLYSVSSLAQCRIEGYLVLSVWCLVRCLSSSQICLLSSCLELGFHFRKGNSSPTFRGFQPSSKSKCCFLRYGTLFHLAPLDEHKALRTAAVYFLLRFLHTELSIVTHPHSACPALWWGCWHWRLFMIIQVQHASLSPCFEPIL